MPGGRSPDGRNPAGSKKPGKKSAHDERREGRENETAKHRWRYSLAFSHEEIMHLTFGPVFVPGNSTAGGAEETSSTVGIVGTTGAGGGGGSAAGSPGSAPQ
ncbi:unnamed protein product, partial [Ascophyllum nodosum]